MNLSTELFQEITESITIIGKDQPRAQERRTPRVRLSSQLSVALWSDPLSSFSLRVRDLSIGGLGIFHNQRIGLDEKVVVKFPRHDQQTALVLSSVVYWEPLAEGLFGVGIQFDRLIVEAELAEQADLNMRKQFNDIGMMARLTQAFARTWRIAS